MAYLLAVDDDPMILRLLKNALELHGHEVDTAERASAVRQEDLGKYGLILLDVMMPGLDGFSFCKQIRDRVQCPILFLTAKAGEESLIQGLLSGGDDYIRKPFSVAELNARVEAHLRRENRKQHAKTIVTGNISLHVDQREIVAAGRKVELTKSQYDICEFLAMNRGLVFSKEQIYDAVYALDSDTLISTITEHIRVIRNKFKEADCNPIGTVWGVGYKWN